MLAINRGIETVADTDVVTIQNQGDEPKPVDVGQVPTVQPVLRVPGTNNTTGAATPQVPIYSGGVKPTIEAGGIVNPVTEFPVLMAQQVQVGSPTPVRIDTSRPTAPVLDAAIPAGPSWWTIAAVVLALVTVAYFLGARK